MCMRNERTDSDAYIRSKKMSGIEYDLLYVWSNAKSLDINTIVDVRRMLCNDKSCVALRVPSEKMIA